MAKKHGRPFHEPNAATRAAVRLLAFGDFTQEQIALRMDISVPTLVKYYADDLAGGKTEMVAALMKKDVENALSNNSDARQSRHFLLERKGGFIKTEKQIVEDKFRDEMRDAAKQLTAKEAAELYAGDVKGD